MPPNPPSPQLLAFVRSRIPMVEHDFADAPAETQAHAQQREAIGRYALSQAFFYAADLVVERPPLVSVKARAYALERWGDQADKVWTLRRTEIPRVDGCKISESGLIYEHVVTGGMFRSFIDSMRRERAGTLDAYLVACWFRDNFQTAWVTREEDKELTKQGHRSSRGASLADAMAVYRACGITLAERPASAPPAVVAGDTVLVAEADEAREEDAIPHEASREGGKYAPFFAAVTDALRKVGPSLRLAHSQDRYYAKVHGAALPGATPFLVVSRNGRVGTPTISLEAVSDRAGEEPSSPAWADLRGSLTGSEWRISYGEKNKQLCRCKRDLAEAFDLADAEDRQRAAEATARALVELWDTIAG
ncbi:MAG: hypothetical protein V4850_01200 [Myxococcota bacterium]